MVYYRNWTGIKRHMGRGTGAELRYGGGVYIFEGFLGVFWGLVVRL